MVWIRKVFNFRETTYFHNLLFYIKCNEISFVINVCDSVQSSNLNYNMRIKSNWYDNVLSKTFLQFNLKQTRRAYIRFYVLLLFSLKRMSLLTFLVMRTVDMAAALDYGILLYFCVLLHTRHSPTLRLGSPSFPQATSSITV